MKIVKIAFIFGILMLIPFVTAVENVTFEDVIFYVYGYNNQSIWFTKPNTTIFEGQLRATIPYQYHWYPKTHYLYWPGYSGQNFNVSLNGIWLRSIGGGSVTSQSGIRETWEFNGSLDLFNISETGTYNLTLNLTKNWTNFTVANLSVKIIRDIETNDSLSVNLYPNYYTSHNKTLNLTKPGFAEINFTINITWANETCHYTDSCLEKIDLIMYSKPVENLTRFNVTGKYYNILATEKLEKALQRAYLKFYYDETQIAVSESLLRLGLINETTGEVEICADGGVDIDNNFVYCNSTHFSEWGIVSLPEEEPEEQSPPSSSSDGGNGGTTGGTTGGTIGGTTPTTTTPPTTEEPKVTKVVTETGKAIITIPSISANNMSQVTIEKTEALPVTGISITVKNFVNNIQVVITKEPQQPASVTVNITGEVFRYLTVTETNITDADISSTKINFTVEKSWINSSNINSSTIKLQRFKDGNWTALPTVKLSETDTEIMYEAISLGLSIFAITGEKIKAEEPEEIPLEEEPIIEQLKQIPVYVYVILALAVIVVIGYLIYQRKLRK